MIANKTKPKVCLLLREKGTNEKKNYKYICITVLFFLLRMESTVS